MRNSSLIAVALTLLGLALQPAALASSQAGVAIRYWASAELRDVALTSARTLEGQVVDGQGMAQANCEVWITRDDGKSVKTRTDARGRFSTTEISSGYYRIETASGGGKFRLWEHSTAPSDAASQVLLVVNSRNS